MHRWGITLENLAIGYKGKPLLKGLSLFMDEGEFWVVVGPNGAGKSTLLKTILGIVPPVEGKVYIHGIDCTFHVGCDEKKFISYVPQLESYSKIFPATALDVVLSGLFMKKKRLEKITDKDVARAVEWLEFFDMAHLKNTPFKNLSGGQQRKVLIARALISSPHYLFLDEPTTGVDIKSARRLINAINFLHKNNRIGICMVTHDLNFVWNYVEKVLVLGNGKFVAGNKDSIINEDILSEIYGVKIKILETPAGPVFLTGDKHY
ncbi:metal ABC transporter ATP-binding protein [Desulfurobacterium atlanticum]|uniref:Iron complex transport system ATP-binding protein/zinc transport system ATP-binding protein/manganese/zinc/iron transport system ATP- binding protein n=1 Tax=Desulfurobacterium atlanticum TaxID=240169 RepID=A0A238ZN70_9BACT|nr:ABC transporter ATP-binding protein [Desulfurobacterium atlanticum]SNR84408.1 iron complex transport system ATP-binding protein/zinc transport system ATP-binding protein/manganese/zinc/iron transport system ATP- binding protein [Desulfurobacterium atlanticum]